jgi:hypothetical protein
MINWIADHDSPSPSPAEQLVFDVFERGGKTSYPELPGHKGGGTSQEAAEAIAPVAPGWRGKVLRFLCDHSSQSWLPDEVAKELDASPFLIRPRFTELQAAGLIARTGERRRNIGSTLDAAAYRPTPLALSAGKPSETEGK